MSQDIGQDWSGGVLKAMHWASLGALWIRERVLVKPSFVNRRSANHNIDMEDCSLLSNIYTRDTGLTRSARVSLIPSISMSLTYHELSLGRSKAL